MKLSPIIFAEEFSEIQNQENLILIEAGNGNNSREIYQQNHLKNAFYLDLNQDLAEISADAKFGGRHPLPKIENFAASLEKLGVTKESRFIIYDRNFGANAAARLWWMLRSIGFEKVQVLNGGFQFAEKFGIETSAEIPIAKISGNLELTSWKLPTKNLEEIKNDSQDSSKIIIDVRENARYNGETEPIDLVAGHIPNAINIQFKENLNDDGTFKNPEILKEFYEKYLKNYQSGNITIHCGSGVTACHTLLALDYAGFKIPNLYVGSWSEWSRNNLEIEMK
jgi:thiosulfate/3-mercaptopyruvate sulfurtransferase